MATVFWIADGKRYVKEASRSAESLERHMPDVQRILFTTNADLDDVFFFDEVRALPPRRHEWWFLDAAHYFGLAVDGLKDHKLVYLDTDTWVCAPFADLFDVLNKYDIAAAHAPGRETSCFKGVPEAFCEINIGVVGIRRHPKTIWAMYEWYDRYSENPELYGNNDQGALRHVLWDSNLRLYILPPEYNMRWQFGGFAKYKVKVLHGRTKDYRKVCKQLNETTDMRGWCRSCKC